MRARLQRLRGCLLLVCLAAGLGACGEEADSVVVEPPLVGEPPPGPGPVPTMPEPPAVAQDAGPWRLDPARGQALFEEKCQQCHGAGGAGGYGPALNNPITCPPCAGFTRLWQRIDEFMPLRNPESCDADCSRQIAAWISNGFSTAPSCTVEFRYDDVAGRRFAATLRVTNNRGLDVPSWRLAFSLPGDHSITAVSHGVVVQSGGAVLIAPTAATAVIADQATLTILLEGLHGGIATEPADLRLEASPCFAAPAAI